MKNSQSPVHYRPVWFVVRVLDAASDLKNRLIK